MNLVKLIQQYNNDFLFFCEPIKNNIMNDGNFIRIIYSSNIMVLNGIYLLINLTDVSCDKYYNKYKCNFNIYEHKEIIESLTIIENEILKKYKTNKIPSFKISEQLKEGNIKLFNDLGNMTSCSFILKISGIWETQTNYGLTYKFIKTTTSTSHQCKTIC